MACLIGASFFVCSVVADVLLGGQWAIPHYLIRRKDVESALTTGLTRT